MSYFAEQKTVRDLLMASSIYRIPRNQRKYVWNQDNWEDLFLDLEFATNNNVNHFIGSVVLLREKEKIAGLTQYTVIDGQQRLFTITIFLISLLFIMKKYGLKDDYYGSQKYLIIKDDKNCSHEVFNSSYHLGLEKLLNATTKIEFNSSQSAYSFAQLNIADKKRDKNIFNSFIFFVGKIEEYIQKNNHQKITLIRDAIINTEYVRIEATTQEDSYTIFEILNARGQALADHELLKNYVMRYIQPKERVDNIKQEWEDMEKLLGRGINKYLFHYLIHKYKIDESDRKDPYKAIKKYVKANEIEEFYKDFIQKSHYDSKLYSPILKDCDNNEICSKLEYDVFGFFKTKRQEQFRPVLLSLMHQLDLENLSKAKYEEL